MIKPTIGRVVWYHDSTRGDGPFAAIVAKVWNDTLVNLAVFDANGNSRGETSVTLIQESEERPGGRFAEWMPYQKGQAAKTEALEAAAKTTG